MNELQPHLVHSLSRAYLDTKLQSDNALLAIKAKLARATAKAAPSPAAAKLADIRANETKVVAEATQRVKIEIDA